MEKSKKEHKEKKFLGKKKEKEKEEENEEEDEEEKEKEEVESSNKNSPKNNKKSELIVTDDEVILHLDNKKRLTISKFKGRLFVNIREYYDDNGTMKPGKKGITLSKDCWKKISDNISDINEAIDNMS